MKLRPPPMTTTTTTYNLPNHKPSTETTLNLSMHDNHLYAAIGNIIHVIDTSSFTLLDTFNVARTSSGSVKSVTFCNGHIFTAHQDHKIRVWKLGDNKRQKHIATLPTLEDRILRSVLPKNYVKIRRHRKKLWIEHYDVVSRLAVINEKLICSVSWDKYLKIWNVGDFKCVQSIKAHDDAINDIIVYAADGEYEIFTGSADGKIKIWGNVLGKYELIATLEKHKPAGVNALALNNDGSVLFSGASDCLIIVWCKALHGSNGMVLNGVLRGHSKAILCLINVRDLLFSGSADRTVRIWRRDYKGTKFCCLKVLDGYERPVRSLVVEEIEATFESKDGVNVRVFSESSNGVVKICTIEGLNLDLESMCIHV